MRKMHNKFSLLVATVLISLGSVAQASVVEPIKVQYEAEQLSQLDFESVVQVSPSNDFDNVIAYVTGHKDRMGSVEIADNVSVDETVNSRIHEARHEYNILTVAHSPQEVGWRIS